MTTPTVSADPAPGGAAEPVCAVGTSASRGHRAWCCNLGCVASGASPRGHPPTPVLAFIAFWPQHVDSGVPSRFWWDDRGNASIVTYTRVEFGANVLLFVPLGVLLAILLPARRWLVLPSALLISGSIETLQGVFIRGRTASILDVLANVIGAGVGLVVVVITARTTAAHPRCDT